MVTERRAARRRAEGIGRRGFLRSTAVAGASLALSARVQGAAAEPAPSEVRVAIIGLGTRGLALLGHLSKIPGVRVAAIADVWEAFSLRRGKSMLSRYGHDHRAYKDHRSLLDTEKGLDAAIVATPDVVHSAQAVDCLEAGLHVYCERPLARSLEESRRVVRAAKAAGKQVQVGHEHRSHPRYRFCRERLLGEVKLLGRLTAASAQWHQAVESPRGWPRRFSVPEDVLKATGFGTMERFRNWRWYRDLGVGPFVEHGSDQIDVLGWMLGSWPTAVLASGGTDYYERASHEWPDTVFSIFEFPNGGGSLRADYRLLTTSSSLGHFERILGDEGGVRLSDAAGRTAIYREPTAPEWERWVRLGYLKRKVPKEEARDDAPAGVDQAVLDVTETAAPLQYLMPVEVEESPTRLHLQNFLAAVRGDAKLHCPAETAHAALACVLRAQSALEAGGRTAIEPADIEA